MSAVVPPAPIATSVTTSPSGQFSSQKKIEPLDPLSAARERLHAVKNYVNNPSRSDKEKTALLQELNKINDQIGAWANTGGSEQGSRQVRYTTLYPSMNRYYHQIAQEIGTPQTKDLTNYGLLTNAPTIRKTNEIEKIASTKEQQPNNPPVNQPSQHNKKPRTIVKGTQSTRGPITDIPKPQNRANQAIIPSSTEKIISPMGNVQTSKVPSKLIEDMKQANLVLSTVSPNIPNPAGVFSKFIRSEVRSEVERKLQRAYSSLSD
ncbi:MAG: hypothetical protein AABX52_00915, partial [Nanoarchaeota archaeon]